MPALNSAKKLKIGILQTGRVPQGLVAAHGDYPAMFENWLAPLDADFVTYAALDGVLPGDPGSCDLWVVTGSRHGAYEDHDWIAPLEQFIRVCADTGQKMIGICFGHQIIAQAMGGKVEKSQKGWGLGVHEYDAFNWPGAQGARLVIQTFHQDQVVRPAQGATLIARSDFCENAAFWYPGFALTFQGHPEMGADYVLGLLDTRRGSAFDAGVVDRARATMNDATTSRALAMYLRDNLAMI